MKRLSWIPLGLALAALCGGQASAQFNTIVFEENFDSLAPTLGDSVNERVGFPLVTALADDPDSAPVPGVFSATGPTGWTVNNALGEYQGAPTIGNAGVPGTGLPEYGVDEWDGWTFVDKQFWVDTEDQDRGMFDNATGAIAVVDPDEYFDEFGGTSDEINGGYYNSGLSTPSVSTTPGQIYSLSFDSSWRPEAFDDGHPDPAIDGLNNQAAEVLVRFDNGSTITLDAWDSEGPAMPGDPIPASFKDDTPNESLAGLNFGVPGGASSFTVEFNVANAGNDWWWAIDNVQLQQLTAPGQPMVIDEDFEGVALGDSVNERLSLVPEKITAIETDSETTARPDSFTHTPPAGWTNDNSQVAGVGNPEVGVEEWEGWSFVTPEFWFFAEEGDRVDFTKGTGVIAVADPDEWDDLEGDIGGGEIDGPADIALFDATLSTPAVDITDVAEGELAIEFDATWREEGTQTAVLTVDYNDGNGPLEILRWESADGDANFFQDDLLNETVLLRLANPLGATEATFAWRLSDAGNNFWWAIDNIRVGAIPEPTSAVLLMVAAASAASVRRGRS